MTRLPCSDSSSSRSVISLTTMAVLLMASAPDRAKAVCQPMPHKPGAIFATGENSARLVGHGLADSFGSIRCTGHEQHRHCGQANDGATRAGVGTWQARHGSPAVSGLGRRPLAGVGPGIG